MLKFIIYSRKSRNAQDGHLQHTHKTSEWEIKNYLDNLTKNNVPYEIVDHVVEDITGFGYYTKRPLFSKVVERCREDKSLTLLASKYDRIARDAWTGSELLKTINMVVATMPDAEDFTSQVLFGVAEKECALTSQRFKATAAAKRQRCLESGEEFIWGGSSPKWRETYFKNKALGLHKKNRVNTARQELSKQKATEVEKIIRLTRANNLEKGLTLCELADILNQEGIKTTKGLDWTESALSGFIKRKGIEYKRKNRNL